MVTSPAIIKTATWDVVAWNRAAVLVLTDYGALPPVERSILRLVFRNDRVRGSQGDWEETARFVVGAFRADAARAGGVAEVGQLVAELCATSPAFVAPWAGKDVRFHGEGFKRLRHPNLGAIELDYPGFAVDGRPDVGMIVYRWVDPGVAEQSDCCRPHRRCSPARNVERETRRNVEPRP